jgi:hypothetical protein
VKRLLSVAALIAMAVFVAPAAADHFEPNSSKSCGTLISGQVNCTLTINIEDEIGIPPGEDIFASIDVGPTGATFSSASQSGGTCGAAVVTVDSPTLLRVNPDATTILNNCTIIISEVLDATAAGQVCQTLNSASNAPPFTVCANIQAGPATADDCKQGGWETFGGVFKNQGDCVSYVVTDGRNAPAGP